MFKPEIDLSDLQPRNSKYFNLAQSLSADKLVIRSRKFTDNSSRLAAVCRGSRLAMAGELVSSTFTKDGAIFDTGEMLSNSWLLDSMSSSSFVHLSIPEMSRLPSFHNLSSLLCLDSWLVCSWQHLVTWLSDMPYTPSQRMLMIIHCPQAQSI